MNQAWQILTRLYPWKIEKNKLELSQAKLSLSWSYSKAQTKLIMIWLNLGIGYRTTIYNSAASPGMIWKNPESSKC